VSPLLGTGRRIFTERGCVGCHGPMGKGTTIAPSLVGVTGKFGNEQLEALLRNPNPRMRAGGMPAVNASPGDISALLAYLAVLGTSSANVPAERQQPFLKVHSDASRPPAAAKKVALVTELPPNPGSSSSIAPTVAAAPADTGSSTSAESVAAGQKLFLKRGCFTCHGRGGVGGLAPALAPLVAQLSDSQLRDVLVKPTAKMKEGGMPPVQVSSEELDLLLSYLRTLPPPRQ
jgi:mono/diheme cytochrome c family protein